MNRHWPPHSPFSSLDIRSSSRLIRISFHDEILVEKGSARLLYETGLSVRFYVPRHEVSSDLLPSNTATQCAYKGTSLYYSLNVAGSAGQDVAWTYKSPWLDAQEVPGDISVSSTSA